MYNGKKKVAIVDVETIQDQETGDRYKKVTSGKQLVLDVDLVGVQTLQLGQIQNVNLSYSVKIPRLQFNAEKYCFFDDQLYEISIVTKAKTSVDLLLNVAKLEDEEVENAIRDWIKGV